MRFPEVRRPRGKRFPRGYNPEYREDVSRLRCILFGKPGHICGPSEPMHVHAEAQGLGDVGQIVPACAQAHRTGWRNFHSVGRYSFCQYWGLGSFEDLENLAHDLAVQLGYRLL